MKIISIILPCYQEEKNIYKNTVMLYDFLIKKILKHSIELILINDGSTDKTWKELKKIQKNIPNTKIISYKTNRGKWYAVTQGLKKSRGNIIGLYDSDGDIPREFLMRYIQRLLDNRNLDIIIGSKLAKWSKVEVSLKRKIMSHTNHMINSILFELPIRDTQVWLKVFRKDIRDIFLENVTTTWYAFDIDFLFHVHNAWYTITEENVSIQIDNQNSQVTPIRIVYFLRDILLLFRKVNYKILKRKISLKSSSKIYILRSIVIPTEKFLNIFLYIYKILTSNNK